MQNAGHRALVRSLYRRAQRYANITIKHCSHNNMISSELPFMFAPYLKQESVQKLLVMNVVHTLTERTITTKQMVRALFREPLDSDDSASSITTTTAAQQERMQAAFSFFEKNPEDVFRSKLGVMQWSTPYIHSSMLSYPGGSECRETRKTQPKKQQQQQQQQGETAQQLALLGLSDLCRLQAAFVASGHDMLACTQSGSSIEARLDALDKYVDRIATTIRKQLASHVETVDKVSVLQVPSSLCALLGYPAASVNALKPLKKINIRPKDTKTLKQRRKQTQQKTKQAQKPSANAAWGQIVSCYPEVVAAAVFHHFVTSGAWTAKRSKKLDSLCVERHMAAGGGEVDPALLGVIMNSVCSRLNLRVSIAGNAVTPLLRIDGVQQQAAKTKATKKGRSKKNTTAIFLDLSTSTPTRPWLSLDRSVAKVMHNSSLSKEAAEELCPSTLSTSKANPPPALLAQLFHMQRTLFASNTTESRTNAISAQKSSPVHSSGPATPASAVSKADALRLHMHGQSLFVQLLLQVVNDVATAKKQENDIFRSFAAFLTQ